MNDPNTMRLLLVASYLAWTLPIRGKAPPVRAISTDNAASLREDRHQFTANTPWRKLLAARLEIAQEWKQVAGSARMGASG
jgi:hypothetical protein